MRIKIETSNNNLGWREWFAWFPVKIENYWVWMEVVMRTKVFIKDFDGDGHEFEKFHYDYKFID